MRIDDNYLPPQGRITTGELSGTSATGRSEASSVRANGSTSNDSVMLSGLTALLAKVSELGSNTRAELVQRVSAEYRSGTYTVDNLALADGLIDRAFEG